MARFGLDEVQAQAILDMQLKRLQGLEKEKLEAEYAELEKRIAYYDQLLADEAMLRGVLKDELSAIRDKYGDERFTEIQDVEDEIDIEDLIEEEQCVFTLTQAGYIKRTPVSEYAAQSKGRHGQEGHHHPGGGLRGGRVHRLHPRLYPLLYRHGQGLPEEGLSDPGSWQDGQGHQHHQYPPGGVGRAGPDHDPHPVHRGRRPLPLHGHPEAAP